MNKYVFKFFTVVILIITFICGFASLTFAKTDEELMASNEIEFFVVDSNGSWWITYPANAPVGNKYWHEVIEGVELSGIRIDKVSDFRYQLIPETPEQIDLLFGYGHDNFTDSIKLENLQSFLMNVDSPTANERIESEKIQAEEKQKQAILKTEQTKLKSASTDRWSSTINSYLYDNGDGTFNVVDYSNNAITVNTYSNNDYTLLSTKSVPFELEIFGGFYSGEKYNYIAFGQNNTEESDTKEVIRIVKYDKNFNRISHASVSDCYTVYPFNHSLRMCEEDNTMIIHTARTRYLTEDGLNHQSQLTIILDTDNMTVKNMLGSFQENHVSHSFNQFVIHDGNNFVLLDHGDAYPRSIVLNKHEYVSSETGPVEYDGKIFSKYTSTDLFEIPGAIGANCTGVTIGGFESSSENYLATINTIDHSKVSEYTSFEMKGLGKDERNVVLLVSDKDNTKTSNVKQVYLTDYIGKNKLASKPYLVKISDDRFLVLWEEFEYTDSYDFVDNGVKYVQVNGNGEIISDTRTNTDLLLSSDCQPEIIDNNLMWYVDIGEERKFYSIDLDTALITVTLNNELINFDQPPTIVEGRTLVPLRAIFESLGATVEWNGETQTVTSQKGSTSISLSINSNTMYKDGKAVTLDVPAQLINDRTLVPARAVAEAFGCDVDWDDESKRVIITN